MPDSTSTLLPKVVRDQIEVIRPRPVAAVFLTAILMAAVFVVAWFMPPGYNVLGTAVAMALLFFAIGYAVSGRPLGIFINERNLVSLSRFQMALWSIVVLSAYLTYVFARMKAGVGGGTEALNVEVDWRLWTLLGISTTSLVGAPLILGATKKEKKPDQTTVEATGLETNEGKEEINANREGTLYANTSIKDARFTDLFQGDEVGNTTRVDLPKVQMFFFTMIAALVFLAAAIRNLGGACPDLSKLPVLSDGILALMGVSHTGYLTGKGLDHTDRDRTPPESAT